MEKHIVWGCTSHNYTLCNEGFISICLKCSHDRTYVKMLCTEVLKYELETNKVNGFCCMLSYLKIVSSLRKYFELSF